MIYSDYGRLAAVGKAIGNADSYWLPSNANLDGLSNSLTNAGTLAVYRSLVPAVYEKMSTTDYSGIGLASWGGGVLSGYDSDHAAWAQVTPSAFGLVTGRTLSYVPYNAAFIGAKPLFSGGKSNPKPPSAALFTTMHGLGVTADEMFDQWPFRTTTCDAAGTSCGSSPWNYYSKPS